MPGYGYSTPYGGMAGGALPQGYLEAATAPGRSIAQGLGGIGAGLGKALAFYQQRKDESDLARAKAETALASMYEPHKDNPYMEFDPQGKAPQFAHKAVEAVGEKLVSKFLGHKTNLAENLAIAHGIENYGNAKLKEQQIALNKTNLTIADLNAGALPQKITDEETAAAALNEANRIRNENLPGQLFDQQEAARQARVIAQNQIDKYQKDLNQEQIVGGLLKEAQGRRPQVDISGYLQGLRGPTPPLSPLAPTGKQTNVLDTAIPSIYDYTTMVPRTQEEAEAFFAKRLIAENVAQSDAATKGLAALRLAQPDVVKKIDLGDGSSAVMVNNHYQHFVEGMTPAQQIQFANLTAQGRAQMVERGVIDARGQSHEAPTKEEGVSMRKSQADAEQGIELANQLLELNAISGKSIGPGSADYATRATNLRTQLIAAIKKGIIGPGPVSEDEWVLLNNLAVNPTKMFQWDSTAVEALNDLKDGLQLGLRTQANSFGWKNYAGARDRSPREGATPGAPSGATRGATETGPMVEKKWDTVTNRPVPAGKLR